MLLCWTSVEFIGSFQSAAARVNSELRTAVIVPMLMATLADGQNLLRITVLSSLRATNAADWQLKSLSPQHSALVSPHV